MITRILCSLVGILFILQPMTYAVINSKEFKRRESSFGGGGLSNSYGPPLTASSPLPIPVYGVPGPVAKYPPPPPDIPPPISSSSIPHQEYGPPRPTVSTPSREYGVPFLQYGPPKVNVEYGVPLLKNIPLKNGFSSVGSFQSAKSQFFDQIKSHFGIPKPVYGPPHYIQRPNAISVQNFYGPPPQSFQSYLPPIKPLSLPSTSYGPPMKLSPVYGPPQSGHHLQSFSVAKPGTSYGTPQFNFGSKFSSFAKPPQAAPVYGPPSTVIAGTYVPPSHKPAPVYGPPQPPPSFETPSFQPPGTSYGVPENSNLASSSNHQHNSNLGSQSIKQVQIIEGNDHGGPTVSCDGWKPIPGPVGGNIHTQGSVANVGYSNGYSNVHSSSSSELSSHHSEGSHGNLISGLTDEQLVAIALGGDGNQQIAVTTSDDDFHSAHNSVDSNLVQSYSLELPREEISDSYGAPPPDSFAPNSLHAQKYETINLNHNDPVGLVPPSGSYGPPPSSSYHAPSPLPPSPPSHHGHGHGHAHGHTHGHSHAHGHPPGPGGLGITYGSQTGNLKPWIYSGTPPKKPILYRPPVPQGLLESIGATVQHLDQYGVPPEKEPPTYIPPPLSEIPQQGGLEEHHLASHSEHVSYTQSLPSLQEPRFNQAQDCGHGPSLSSGDFGNYDIGSSQITSYSNIESQRQQISGPIGQNEIPSDSYGPPPSGNAGDAHTYESQQNSVHIGSQSSTSHSQSSSEQIDTHNSNLDSQNYITSDNQNTVTIPVQGHLGSYQLQFQSADQLGAENSGSNHDHPNHEQILSEGLLQSIISAIEQQPQNQSPQINHHQHTDQADSRSDHKEANEFLQSPEAEKALSESSETEQK